MSRLTRSIAPWHPAVAYALACSLIIGIAAGISHGPSSGLHGAVTIFLGWAIVRELAPSRPMPGLLAPWATLPFTIPAEADLRACVAVLLAARIAARTTGASPTLLDCVLLVPFCAWAAVHPAGCPVALVLAATMFVEGRLRHRIAAVASLAAVLAVGSVEGTLTVQRGADHVNLAEQVLLVLLLVAALVAILRRPPARLHERADRGRARLSGRRVRSARVAAAAAVVASVIWTGLLGPFALAAVSGAIVAVGVSGGRYREAAPADHAA